MCTYDVPLFQAFSNINDFENLPETGQLFTILAYNPA